MRAKEDVKKIIGENTFRDFVEKNLHLIRPVKFKLLFKGHLWFSMTEGQSEGWTMEGEGEGEVRGTEWLCPGALSARSRSVHFLVKAGNDPVARWAVGCRE